MTETESNGHSSVATTDPVEDVLARRRRGLFGRRRKRYNRRIRWWRIIAIALPLSFLAVISFAFGMVVAFSPQISPLVNTLKRTYTHGANSTIYSDNGTELAILTNHDQFFLQSVPLDSIIAHAVVAVEDKRFYTEPAIDFRGVARALVADLFGGGGTQGGSTITEQFVKTALDEGLPSQRTLTEKLKEAGIAFQLSHLWSKGQILTQYLNTSFFGVATGVEAAAEAWFGNDPSSTLFGCGQNPSNANPESLCVTNLSADQAALLAGIIDEPSNYVTWLTTDPERVYGRRNLVLKDMMEQGYLTPSEYQADVLVSLPNPEYVKTPSQEDTQASSGYFADWIRQQLLANRKFSNLVYGGGLRVYTTLDTHLQSDAQNAVDNYLPANSGGPSAALVAIDSSTGDVRAMVGGYNFNTHAFNLATQAERQPGSAFKAFDLAAALEAGYNANTKVLSAGPATFTAPAPFYSFTVHNDEHAYYDAKIPLSLALAVSDNSVFARLSLTYPGMNTERIANLAKTFGITTGISINPSMVIGGLTEGVTPLDMAHAYETIAEGGYLISGSLASQQCAGGAKGVTQPNAPPPGSSGCPGPVGIRFVAQGPQSDTRVWRNETYRDPTFFPASYDAEEISMMRGVLSPIGTAADAAIPGVAAWGKTGTTSNYTDAWFVGSTPVIHTAHGDIPSMTVAVWVGYPNRERSMAKDYGGKPVYGGTYPALIWRDYILAAIQTIEAENQGAYRTPSHHTSSKSGSTGSGGAATSGSGNTAQNGTTSAAGANANGGTAAASTTQKTNSAVTGPTGAGAGATGGAGLPATSTPPSTTSPPPGTSPGGGVTAPSGGALAPGGG